MGFHKTGTTSLAKALTVLGYRVCGFVNPKPWMKPSTHTREQLFEMRYKPLLDMYDAFQDTLWFVFYKELAQMYPEGKFILTMRPAESWYESALKHFGGYDRLSFQWIYDGKGDPAGNRELYMETYNRHNREVAKYFSKSGSDFLIMNLPEDFNWDLLCGFLDCPKPSGSFPHANSADSRFSVKNKIVYQVKNKYYKWNSNVWND